MLPTRLLHRAKGVPGWAQHMAKQPTKAGRLPPTAWSNAPPNGDSSHVPNPDEPAPGASQAPSGSEVKSQSPGASQASGFPAAPASNTPPAGSAGSDTRAWSEIRSGAAQASQGMKQAINDAVPDGARMAPKQEGPWGPKRDRSKGLMDSFRGESWLWRRERW